MLDLVAPISPHYGHIRWNRSVADDLSAVVSVLSKLRRAVLKRNIAGEARNMPVLPQHTNSCLGLLTAVLTCQRDQVIV